MDNPYQYISFNQEYQKLSDFCLNPDNRAFRYGDAIFETIRANGTEPLLFEEHYARLKKGVGILQLQLPSFFDHVFLKNQIKGLLTRCKLFQAARVKVTLIRQSGGRYIPVNNMADILIEAEYTGTGPYELNSKGLLIDAFTAFPKPIAPYTSVKTLNTLPYVLAGIFASNEGFDDALLINHEGFIIEATSSNLFALKGKKLSTPSLQLGCVEGVMRNHVLTIARQSGYMVDDEALILPEDLLSMDEVFLTNAIAGIKWVGGYKNRRYYKKNANILMMVLNKKLLGD
jgi:branched-subunit amino acid aminotransferase/4-amino-4-deoxychorismate lyase